MLSPPYSDAVSSLGNSLQRWCIAACGVAVDTDLTNLILFRKRLSHPTDTRIDCRIMCDQKQDTPPLTSLWRYVCGWADHISHCIFRAALERTPQSAAALRSRD